MAATRRNTSLSGSSRLSLSVNSNRPKESPTGIAGRHPLKQEWSLSYIHRPVGAKVDYEKSIRKVATFGSIESFLHLYSHLTPPNELPPVTDVLVFLGRIGRPGVWEEMRDGGKFTLRLIPAITPFLFETLLLALLGDQFDDSDAVVGCVLSVREKEGILSVWVEEEGEGVRSGALREKILSLLSLPPSTICEYRSNRALLDAASNPIKPQPYPSSSDALADPVNPAPTPAPHAPHHHHTSSHSHSHGHHGPGRFNYGGQEGGGGGGGGGRRWEQRGVYTRDRDGARDENGGNEGGGGERDRERTRGGFDRPAGEGRGFGARWDGVGGAAGRRRENGWGAPHQSNQ